MGATDVLNKVCQELGVCLPKGELPMQVGVKYIRRMEKDGAIPVLAVLWEDGAITSIAFKDKETVCAHTEMKGGNEAYWAWCAHLAARGYREIPVEVESEALDEKQRKELLARGIVV